MKFLLQAARPLLFDLLATLVFAGIVAVTHDARLAAALALAAGVVQLVATKLAKRPIGALQWVSLALVAVFGGATLVTHDARFMMFKPTLIYALVGGAMLERGWMRRYMPPQALAHVPDSHIVGWGYAWAGLMGLTAALNAVFALWAGVALWAAFLVVFPPASKGALFLLQFGLMRADGLRRARRLAKETGN